MTENATATDAFIETLPKCELHLHIEGTLEPELKFALAERNRLRLPHGTVEEMRAAYRFDDLTSFLASYYEGMQVLRTAADFYDLTRAYLEKAAGQGVRYAEIFFDPQAHTSRGVPFDVVIGGIRRAQLEAERTLGLPTGLIMCFLRDFQAEYAMATLLESLPYRQWIVGVGLDSDERGHPPAKFAQVFDRARREGYLITAHCDVDQQDSVEHIRQCVEDIRVDRIDHGSNVLESPELVAEVVRRGLGLTCCPISNRWVSDGTKAELIKQLLDLGVKVTVNSDDPAYFGGYVAENLVAMREAGFSPDELITLQRNAIDISWAPPEVKRDFRGRLDALVGSPAG
ncbi:adenosine deaminase [Pseudonocardia sp. C8]|uniref:adenosine deaminase n=1 Tax=Pseudonocardia sp. C8 TaxID=2762759 RepID=UPI001642C5A8|nr:adenosine deaminase [Pseudonocardia sp. C8]MBC3192277.1 adenosine deaminase [Pseudonocardia sp. C8]